MQGNLHHSDSLEEESRLCDFLEDPHTGAWTSGTDEHESLVKPVPIPPHAPRTVGCSGGETVPAQSGSLLMSPGACPLTRGRGFGKADTLGTEGRPARQVSGPRPMIVHWTVALNGFLQKWNAVKTGSHIPNASANLIEHLGMHV